VNGARSRAARVVTGAAVLWVALAGVTFAARPLLPVDETRYVAVAWEMWREGSWLVPMLNGEPYDEKPPLLFWLIGLGWSAFGPSATWARLVPGLGALAALFVVRALGRLLWPQDERVAGIAPWILMGTGLWAIVSTALLFDAMLSAFVLLAVYGAVRAWRGRAGSGWTIAAVAAGLGILTKGPVALLPVVPVWLLGPWWTAPERPVCPRSWYAGAFAALAGAAAIALAWAVPAARAGGESYAASILWGQTAGRVVETLSHGKPWWWYLAQVPWILLPWTLWPPLVRALGALRRAPDEPGTRLCAVWIGVPLVLFSAVHGKQPQYLLPLVPGFALLAARALVRAAPPVGRASRLPLALATAAAGAAFAVVAADPAAVSLPAWVARLPVWTGPGLAAAAVLLVAVPALGFAVDARALATCTAVVLGIVYAAGSVSVGRAYDVRALAAVVAGAQAEGRPVATAGTYQGQFHFAARLARPVESLADRMQPDAWCRAHPDGIVLLYPRDDPRARRAGPGPLYAQPFRGRHAAVWACPDLLAARSRGQS